jgi:cis-L-3-hydroxyproline dehydratase
VFKNPSQPSGLQQSNNLAAGQIFAIRFSWFMPQSFYGQCLIPGTASGSLLHADIGLSFWGGISAETGMVIDRLHPLHGACVAGKIVAIPSGRGSCTGSAVLLELIMAGKAPAALVFHEEETILPLAALLSDALFQRSLPMLRLTRASFTALANAKQVTVNDGCIVADGAADSNTVPAAPLGLQPGKHSSLSLSATDQEMLDGKHGEARQLAMRIITAMARLQGAERLIDITQAHLDCCIYTGPVSVLIAERLRAMGAKVMVPTTLNAISIDRGQWRALGIAPERAAAVEQQTEAYLAMGARPSFTCAPYLLDTAPKPGEHIGWAESNAVAFANSVLGAQTDKYPDYLDLCVALTGRAPASGCHVAAKRQPQIRINITPPAVADDALFPLLGYIAGSLSPNSIPLLTGLEHSAPTRDDLKAFSAAFATTSAAPMFHIAGITPEARNAPCALATAMAGALAIGPADLREAWLKLNVENTSSIVCIAIGNPHASCEELQRIATLCSGRLKSPHVHAILTTGRAMHQQALATGVAAALEKFGFQIILDTCWCMIEEPIIPIEEGCILTNSGKYVHYGPGLTGRRVHYASLAGCIDAAVTGTFDAAIPAWMTG